MTLKRYVLILFLIGFTITGFAQNIANNEASIDLGSQSFLDRTEFKVSYFGSILWNNGLNFGGEYLLKEIAKVKDRKRGQRTNTHQFLLNGSMGFATNFSSKTDTGIFTNFGAIWRRTNKKGKQFSIALNPLGYYRAYLPNTYEVHGDDVDKVFLASRGYYAPSIAVGIGKQRPGKKITGRYFNINFMLRMPYNAGGLPAFNFEYGWRFNLKKDKKR